MYKRQDIGTDHYYYDDYANETSINDVAERSYIPALNTLIEMVKNSGGCLLYTSEGDNKALNSSYTRDGVHPTLEGYKVMEALIKKAIDKVL